MFSTVSIGEDSMISLEGHGENRGSNLMGNKYNIFTFSLIAIPKNAPCISTYDNYCKTVYSTPNIFYIFMVAPEKNLGTSDLEDRVSTVLV
jgi:hypothetical protein